MAVRASDSLPEAIIMCYIEVAKAGDIPAGTLKHIDADGTGLCIANVDGTFFGFVDRCPHMNAPLSMGILNGEILTCPLHFSRFSVRTGEKLSGPEMPQVEGIDIVPPSVTEYMVRITAIMAPIRTGDLQRVLVRRDGDAVLADVGSGNGLRAGESADPGHEICQHTGGGSWATTAGRP